MKKLLKLYIVSSALCLNMASAIAKPVELDRVAAIINKSVVLESEVKELINTVKAGAEKNKQDLPSNRALRAQVLDKLINDTLILDLGERMGVQVSDAELDETLSNMAAQNKISVEELRASIIAEGMSFEN